MAQYKSILTKKALSVKGTLRFTKFVLGSGEVDTIEDVTEVNEPITNLSISNVNYDENQTILSALLDNKNVEVGFWLKEIGIMATEDNGAEFMYAYFYAGEFADYIPDKNYNIDKVNISVALITSNAESVTAKIVKSYTDLGEDEINNMIDNKILLSEQKAEEKFVQAGQFCSEEEAQNKIDIATQSLKDDIEAKLNNNYVTKQEIIDADKTITANINLDNYATVDYVNETTAETYVNKDDFKDLVPIAKNPYALDSNFIVNGLEMTANPCQTYVESNEQEEEIIYPIQSIDVYSGSAYINGKLVNIDRQTIVLADKHSKKMSKLNSVSISPDNFVYGNQLIVAKFDGSVKVIHAQVPYKHIDNDTLGFYMFNQKNYGALRNYAKEQDCVDEYYSVNAENLALNVVSSVNTPAMDYLYGVVGPSTPTAGIINYGFVEQKQKIDGTFNSKETSNNKTLATFSKLSSGSKFEVDLLFTPVSYVASTLLDFGGSAIPLLTMNAQGYLLINNVLSPYKLTLGKTVYVTVQYDGNELILIVDGVKYFTTAVANYVLCGSHANITTADKFGGVGFSNYSGYNKIADVYFEHLEIRQQPRSLAQIGKICNEMLIPCSYVDEYGRMHNIVTDVLDDNSAVLGFVNTNADASVNEETGRTESIAVVDNFSFAYGRRNKMMGGNRKVFCGWQLFHNVRTGSDAVTQSMSWENPFKSDKVKATLVYKATDKTSIEIPIPISNVLPLAGYIGATLNQYKFNTQTVNAAGVNNIVLGVHVNSAQSSNVNYSAVGVDTTKLYIGLYLEYMGDFECM